MADAAYGPWLEAIGAAAVPMQPGRDVLGAAHDANEMRALVVAELGRVLNRGLRGRDQAAS